MLQATLQRGASGVCARAVRGVGGTPSHVRPTPGVHGRGLSTHGRRGGAAVPQQLLGQGNCSLQEPGGTILHGRVTPFCQDHACLGAAGSGVKWGYCQFVTFCHDHVSIGGVAAAA